MDKKIIEAEFLACAGLCINDFNYNKKDVLVLNCENEKLLEFLDKLHCNIYDTSDVKKDKFDLIIDLKNDTTKHFLEMIKRDSIVIINLANLESSINEALDSIKNADFNIKMPFKVADGYYLFLSNKFHPLSDICLQKIDMTESLKYYNAKIHEAAFAMPNYLKDALKGIAKN